MMVKQMRIALVATVILLSVMSEMSVGDIAVSLDPFSTETATPVAGSNHGWQFTVNTPIVATHLGLFDDWPDGLEIEHPIGLWRLSDSALLASGTMSTGTGDTLIDHFRYIDVPDMALDVGEDYVIGYYSDSGFADRNILKADDLQVNPAISAVTRRWDIAGQFQMPANVYEWDPYGGEPYFPDMFGPNFQFTPEPATVLLLGLGGAILLRRRKA